MVVFLCFTKTSLLHLCLELGWMGGWKEGRRGVEDGMNGRASWCDKIEVRTNLTPTFSPTIPLHPPTHPCTPHPCPGQCPVNNNKKLTEESKLPPLFPCPSPLSVQTCFLTDKAPALRDKCYFHHFPPIIVSPRASSDQVSPRRKKAEIPETFSPREARCTKAGER